MNRKVMYQGSGVVEATPYILTGCIMRRRRDGSFFYQAEITDLAAGHSVVVCSLDDISRKGE